MVDVTDRPYPDMVAAMKTTGAKLLDVRLGKQPPTSRPTGAEAQ
jgi:hypothetical protein